MKLNEKHIFYVTVCAICASLLAIGGFVAWVDPYQQYGAHPDRYCGDQRSEIGGVAKHHDYDAVVTGSSMAMNHYPEQIDSLFGWKTKNFSMAGAYYDDLAILLPHVIKIGKVKNIIMTLDDFEFTKERGATCKYLYDSNMWNDYQYLFNATALQHAINVFLGHSQKEHNLYHFTYDVNREALMKNFTSELRKPQSPNEHYDFKTMKNRFDTSILPIIKNAPQSITWHIYFPPYSICVFIIQDKHGTLQDIISLKQYMIAQLEKYPNVKLYNFQCSPWIDNLDEFMDICHHNHKYNRAIIQSIHKNQYRINSSNFSPIPLINLVTQYEDSLSNYL